MWSWNNLSTVENKQNIWYKTMPFHTAVAETYQHVKRERKETSEEEHSECEKQVGLSLRFLTDYRVDDTGPLEVEAAPAEDDAPESFLE